MIVSLVLIIAFAASPLAMAARHTAQKTLAVAFSALTLAALGLVLYPGGTEKLALATWCGVYCALLCVSAALALRENQSIGVMRYVLVAVTIVGCSVMTCDALNVRVFEWSDDETGFGIGMMFAGAACLWLFTRERRQARANHLTGSVDRSD